MSVRLTPQAMLARISGHVAAISGEIDRMMGMGSALEDPAGKLSQTLDEMRAMAKLVAETRAEVVGMAPPPTDLGDVLDAVVTDTENAAFEILRQAERAQSAAARLNNGTSTDQKADLNEVDDAATAIVLACAFQDITGQRVRKVLSTMRAVESRISALIALMGISDEESRSGQPPAPTGDASLLNGPSSAAQGGLGQSAVDDLFG